MEASFEHALLAFTVLVAVVPFVDSELLALTPAQGAVAAVPSFGAGETPIARSVFAASGDGEFRQRFLCHAVCAFAMLRFFTLSAAVASTPVHLALYGRSGLPGIAATTAVG